MGLLWGRGECDAAIRLEDPLEGIGRVHSGSIETDDDHRFRAALDRATDAMLRLSLSAVLAVYAIPFLIAFVTAPTNVSSSSTVV